jgi:hypothetical protein
LRNASLMVFPFILLVSLLEASYAIVNL